ncbi:RES family NAD+ phosphorylase [Arthrobacter sp. GCM10027362]|uniref:RES family NAD+ phosphorylase n=1 Tax=Arthrobacter sp. GCM10027362 TaxID=3273379 RepID=UPI003629F5B5
MVTPGPPSPFHPQAITLPAGTGLYRVLNNRRHPVEFNPGHGGPTRFAFFGDPPVPVLYAAQTEAAVVSETLLHDVPLEGGFLRPLHYCDKVAARITLTRDARLASFVGAGLRVLKTEASRLTGTDADQYLRTVGWAEAAHGAGFDGAAWMSRRYDTDLAYVLFGDRFAQDDLVLDPGFGRVFAAGSDLDWLITFCAPLHVQVLLHS